MLPRGFLERFLPCGSGLVFRGVAEKYAVRGGSLALTPGLSGLPKECPSAVSDDDCDDDG